MTRSFRFAQPYWLVAPAALLLVFYLVIPVVAMMGLTFFRTSIFGINFTPTLANYERLFSEWLYLNVLISSVRIGISVTVLVVLISFPIAYWLAKRVDRAKMFLLVLVFVPYWINYVVRTYAWLPVLGKEGLVNSLLMSVGIISTPLDSILFNEFSVHLVLVYVFLPFGIIPLYLSLERLDNRVLRASADLGASPADTFRHIILPLSAPGLAGAILTVFVLAVGSYVTPRLVGGPSGIMFGQLIVDQFGATFNWSWGATLATVLALVAMGVVWLISRRVAVTRVFMET